MALEDEQGRADDGGVAAPEQETTYRPLIVLFLLLLAATAVRALVDLRDGTWTPASSISTFMAGFFLAFAAFKLMDLKGFAEGYATYDLLARPVPAYGLAYPFLELGFGLAMLGGYEPAWLLWSELALMAFSGVGVAVKLAKREPFQCACLGTFLKVPLTKVTLVEDFGMALLAGLLLVLRGL
jgi:hypothetical protein